MIQTEKLKLLLEEQGIFADAAQLDQFNRYAEMLLEWNEKINLTAITDPDEILLKHFLDSALLLRYFPFPNKAAFLDVGTGAGFSFCAMYDIASRLEIDIVGQLE